MLTVVHPRGPRYNHQMSGGRSDRSTWALLPLLLTAAACDHLSPDSPPPASLHQPLAVGPAAPGVERAVAAAARRGLPSFLRQLPAGLESEYGFSHRRELDHVSIGPLYQMVALERHGPRLLPSWRVMLTVGGGIRALATVAHTAQGWQVVALGAAQLARELERLEQRLGSHGRDRRRALVRAHTLGADFVVLAPRKVVARALYPLTSARDNLGLGADAVDLADVLRAVAAAPPVAP